MVGMTQNPATVAQSLLDWWRLAGVDWHFGEDVRPLLDMGTPPEQSAVALSDMAGPGTGRATTPATPIEAAPAYPDTLSAFEAFMADRANLIERDWVGPAFAPASPAEAELAIVVAMPDSGPWVASTPFAEATLTLLSNMLRACNRTLDNCHILPIAWIASPDGRIDPTVQAALSQRALHHLSLTGCKEALIFGDVATQCLTGMGILAARRKQPKINHNGRIVTAISTFHPRFLVEQPLYKREAWADLQPLLRKETE